MKILILNTYYYNRGGDSTYAFNLAELLRQHGHTVRFFSMKHPQNLVSEDEKYFVDYIDFIEANSNRSVLTALKVLTRSIYSLHARKKIKTFLKVFSPDVVHVQNIHAHITPSVLFEIKKNKIPIVWTLHDYKLICPNTSFIDHGVICESCFGGKVYSPILHRCKKNSFAASTVISLEAYIHRILGIKNLVHTFVSPSEFLRKKFIEYGWDPNSIVTVNNFLKEDQFVLQTKRDLNYILYIGRIEEIKGIRMLINAMENLTGVHLKIAGVGEIKSELEDICKKKKMQNVEFLGKLSRDDLRNVIKDCSFVVVPSEWYENYPYSILEVMAMGKTVIGSGIGGIPELVQDMITGIIFEPGNVKELEQKILLLINDHNLRKTLERGALSFVQNNNKAYAFYEKITNIYNNAIVHSKN